MTKILDSVALIDKQLTDALVYAVLDSYNGIDQPIIVR